MSEKQKIIEQRMKYMIAKQRLKNKDRLTQKDLDSLDSTGAAFGIAPFVRKDKTDEEIYQNDRTEGLPQEAYEQEDQSISYEAPKMNTGGEFRGGGSAIRGKGFKGVF
jgi:hypothetical protein